MKQSDELKLKRLAKQREAQKAQKERNVAEWAPLSEAIEKLSAQVGEMESITIPEPKDLEPKLDEVNATLINLIELMTSGLEIKNIGEAKAKKLEIANQIQIPKDLATNKAIEGIAKAIEQNKVVRQAIAKAAQTQSQQPEDFIPVRRVYKAGNRFLFDDTSSGSYSGGGGGTTVINSSSSETVYSVNDIEEGTTSYYGFTTSDGTWQVRKITDTLVSYATASNNGAVTSYTDAWMNKATLTYGRYDQAF